MKTEYIGRTIESGLLGAGFWAKCGIFYEGGYRTERAAINAIKRKIGKSIRANNAQRADDSWQRTTFGRVRH